MEQSVEYVAEQRAFYALVSNIMGTRFEIIFYGKSAEVAQSIWEQIAHRLERWHKMLNRFDAESEVGQINSHRDTLPHTISPELEHILSLCKGYWEQTERLFDITRHDMGLIEFGGGVLRKKSEEVVLDFGGFAKGYALHEIGLMLKAEDIGRAIVDFGRSTIMAINAEAEDEGWQISLPSPYDGHEVERYTLRDATLSTSGNTPSYSGHIVNPLTGEPIEQRMMCAVVARDAIEAEVLSTAMMIATQEQMQRIAAGRDDVRVKRYNL